jgi:hypothetical protein
MRDGYSHCFLTSLLIGAPGASLFRRVGEIKLIRLRFCAAEEVVFT